jgi:hypothetical protein
MRLMRGKTSDVTGFMSLMRGMTSDVTGSMSLVTCVAVTVFSDP